MLFKNSNELFFKIPNSHIYKILTNIQDVASYIFEKM